VEHNGKTLHPNKTRNSLEYDGPEYVFDFLRKNTFTHDVIEIREKPKFESTFTVGKRVVCIDRRRS
jgi:hypothetical protein